MPTNLTDAEQCIAVGLCSYVLQHGVGDQELIEVCSVGVLLHLGSGVLRTWSATEGDLLGHKAMCTLVPGTPLRSLLACRIIYKNAKNRKHNYS